MSSLDFCSLTSSTASSINSTYLPKSRIKCSREQITVGYNSFRSASDALLVYLRQYDVSAGKEVHITDSAIDLLRSGNKRCESIQLDQCVVATNQKLSDKSLTGTDLVVDRSSINLFGAKEDVDSLLTSQISSPQLREEVLDTLREARLRHLLKQASRNSQNQEKTELQLEVDAALLRSAQLLEKVTKENISSMRALTCDANNSPSKSPRNISVVSLGSSETEGKQSGHIYSYRRSRPQRSFHNYSLSESLHSPVSYHKHQQPKELRRSASIDNLLPASHKLPPRGKQSFSSSSTSFSNQSDPTDVLIPIRSRSLSSGLRNPRGPLTASEWVEQLDPSVKKFTPSWVGELSPSEVSDSLWNSKSLPEDKKDIKSFSTPSWVGEIDNSKFDKDSYYFSQPRSLIPGILVSSRTANGKDNYYSVTDIDLDNNSCITVDSRPGLNFSDLAISDTHSPCHNKQVTFTNSVMNEIRSTENHQPKHSLPIQTSHTVIYSDTLTQPQNSRMLDSEYNGEAFLHNNILPQTAKLKKSIDNFVASSENLRHKSLSSNLSNTSSDPQSSSLDTLSLLTGKPLLRKDVIAASSLSRDSAVVSQNSCASPAIPVTNPRDGSSSLTSSDLEQNFSNGLDGDRPWEKMAGTFKPPIPVDSEDLPDRNGMSPEQSLEKTLSGRKQPGSMETLKNMLFKLQAEESSTREGSNKNEEATYSSQIDNSKALMDIIPALQNYDFKKEPGGQSLEKALIHLNRLKKLVRSTATSGSNDETVKTALNTELPKRDVEQEGR